MIRAFCVLCVLGVGLAAPASAGQFSVTPVHIHMTPADRAVAVTITNEGNEELVMQADLYLWKQKPDGQDDLTLTEDLFLSPPIIKLAPNARQVVRLARQSRARPSEQLTYRLIVREIPEARPSSGGLQLQIALAFSLPVFITPPGVRSKLECKVERAAPDTVKAVCENSGNAHARATSLQLNNSAGEVLAGDDVGAYILQGVTRSFELKRKDGKIPAGIAVLGVSFADGTTQKYEVSIAD